MHVRLLILIVFIPLLAGTQDVYWRTYGQNEGFPGFHPSIFEQDQDDYLWIGSPDGLLRFNGQEFKYFTVQDGLPGNVIQGLANDPAQERLYISTVQGVSFYQDGLFQRLEIEKPNPDQHFYKLSVAPDGALYISGNGGLMKWKDNDTKSFTKDDGLSSNLVKSTLCVNPDSILIGTSKGIDILVKDQIRGSILAFKDQNIRSLKHGPDGATYVLHGMGNISKYINGIIEFTINERFVTDFYFNSKGKMIIFRMTDIVVYHQEEQLYDYRNIPGTKDDYISFGYVDRQDHCWTFRERKLLQSSPRKLSSTSICTPVDDQFCMSDVQYMSMDDDGSIWIATNTGFGKMKNKKMSEQIFQLNSQDEGLKGSVTSIIEVPGGAIWVSYFIGGISKYEQGQVTNYLDQGSLNETTFYSMLMRDNGELIATRREGYVAIKNGQVTEFRPDVFANRSVTCVVEDHSGVLWFGSVHGGLYAFQDNGSINTFLENDLIREIQIVDSSIWMQSVGNGFVRANLEQGGRINDVQRLNKKNKFPYSGITDFIMHQGILWFTTYDQLIGIRPDQPDIPIISLSTEDQFIPNDWTDNSMVVDQQNVLWLATPDGLQSLDLSSIAADTQLVRLSFVDILLFNESLSSLKKWQSESYLLESSPIKFGPKENYLTFQYDGIYFISPNRIRFRTRIKELNTNWSNWSNNKSVSYNELPPGEYTFQVQADNSAGALTPPISMQFVIATPFWKRPIAQLFILLLIAGVVTAIYYNRVNQVRRKADQQNQINQQLGRLEIEALRAKMNPHFIFNALNSIQHLVIEDNKKGALNYIKKFSTLIRQILDKSSDQKIRISEEIEMIKNYVEIESLRFDHPFSFVVDIESTLIEQDVEIPSLILQPFLENAIHHGLIPKPSPGTLSLIGKDLGDFVQFIIEDDGIGRAASNAMKLHSSAVYQPKGIQVTRDRLHLLLPNHSNNLLTIRDLHDQNGKPSGTRIEILLPILDTWYSQY